METSTNRYLSVVYQLYTVEGEEKSLEEQTSPEHPFEFITGFGIALDKFEQQLSVLEQGSMFDFVLQPDEAFGAYDPAGVHKMERELFSVNGRFDGEHIFPGAFITLTDNEDQYYMAKVVKIEDDGVTVDTNHPLAGKTLNFTGVLRVNRQATDEEIHAFIKQLTGGCNCENGGEGCGHCQKKNEQ